MKKNLFAVIFTMGMLMNAAFVHGQSYTVANHSGMTVTAVSISPIGQNSWGSNLNRSDRLLNGESFSFTSSVDNSNCYYDLRYTTSDGTFYYMPDLNLCSGNLISLANGDLSISKSYSYKKKKRHY